MLTPISWCTSKYNPTHSQSPQRPLQSLMCSANRMRPTSCIIQKMTVFIIGYQSQYGCNGYSQEPSNTDYYLQTVQMSRLLSTDSTYETALQMPFQGSWQQTLIVIIHVLEWVIFFLPSVLNTKYIYERNNPHRYHITAIKDDMENIWCKK